MVRLGLRGQDSYSDIQRVGVPRAFLYYRYGVLWETFFHELEREVVLSHETDQALLAKGEAVSVDECCFASKVYMGHVASLIDSCDAVFVPSMGNIGRHAAFCTKFQALPDLVNNTFRMQHVRTISCLIDDVEEHLSMRTAFLELATRFGANSHEAKHAWKMAAHAQERADHAAAIKQEQLINTQINLQTHDHPPIILLVAHPYLGHDPHIGGTVESVLKRLETTVLHADETNHDRAFRASFDFSETLPWMINRELIGSIMLLHDHVDGIVLVSAFPCGPDSMTNDAIMRCIQGKPILNLIIDAQSGTAGLETRIESFVDILRYQKRGGYLHA